MYFELVRGDERLECDFLVWWNTAELARAFGWKPRSLKPMRRSVSKLMDNSNPMEVADEDAQSLAVAITECRWMLTTKRPTRRQMHGLIGFLAVEGDSFVYYLEEPARIAKFCRNGGFRMSLKCQTTAPENRKLTETTNEIS